MIAEFMCVAIHLDAVAWQPWRPKTYGGSATVQLVNGEFNENGEPVASVSFGWGPTSDCTLAELLSDFHGVADSDWVLEFERPWTSRDFAADDLDLRLVGAVLKHFSLGRSCLATMMVEPVNWESRKIDDRNGRKSVIKHHWAKLGFTTVVGGTGYTSPECVVQALHDFVGPLRSPHA